MTLSYDRLDRHLRWCCSSGDRQRATVDGLERLAGQLQRVENRIDRRIEALEAELDRLGPRTIDERAPEASDELPPKM
jgi:hypothetical protein